MSRDFSKNTANRLSLGVDGINALVSGSSGLTFAAWINADTFNTGAADNRIISECISGTNVSGLFLNIGGSPAVIGASARSQSADSLQTKAGTTTVTAGVWHHVAMVVDFAAGTITPYLDGVAEGGGSATFGTTSYTPSATTGHAGIGCGFGGSAPLSTASQVDGRVDQAAIWKATLSPGEIRAIATGDRMPDEVQLVSLVGYWRLDGLPAQERNSAGNVSHGAITGTVPRAPIAPIVRPFTDDVWIPYLLVADQDPIFPFAMSVP